MARRNNYFVEGLQGAGKSTLVRRLSERLADYKVYHEGDFSPVELAWCAYVTKEQYGKILMDYPSITGQIKEKTFVEGNHKIICYTQILTEEPGFYQDLEKYEIYNGNLDRQAFENVVFERFGKWQGQGQIFECSLFQNIIENQMLYLGMADGEILDFYKKLKAVLKDKPYKVIYLDMEDISEGISIIRKERSDDQGNELWFPLMLKYLEESPAGKEQMLTGLEGLLRHLAKRKALEQRIIREVFRENTVVLRAKKYREGEIAAFLQVSGTKRHET